jgi:hypothetical protein
MPIRETTHEGQRSIRCEEMKIETVTPNFDERSRLVLTAGRRESKAVAIRQKCLNCVDAEALGKFDG